MLVVFLALFAAVSFGGSDYVAGTASRRAGMVTSVTITAEAVKAIVITVVVPLASSQFPSRASLAWGAVSGIGAGVGEMTLYAGLRSGAFNVASSLSAVASAVFTVGAGLIIGERPGVLSVVGIAFAIPAIAGVSLPRGPRSEPEREPGGKLIGTESRRVAPVMWGLVAGVAFGLSLTAINRAGSRTDLWPLAVAELFAVATVACTAVRLGELRPPPPGTRHLALLTGALGSVGMVCFYLATHRGLLAITAVIYSLFPAVTILLARVFQGERLTTTRMIGLGLAAVSVALIAAGGAGLPVS